MRILYLSSGSDKLNSHDYKFLYSLSESGYDLHMVSYHPQQIADDIKNIKNIKIYHYPPKFHKIPLYIDKIFHFRKIIKYIDPDIIHSGNSFNVSFLAALSGFHPILVMPFGSDVLIFPEKYKSIKAINGYVFKKADWVTCDAEYVKKRIIEDYKYDSNKITVFPWGINLDIFCPKNFSNEIREKINWQDKTIIIMNRHFESVYDHETLIKAFYISIDKNPKLRLLLVGDGTLKEKTKNLILKYELEKYVYMTGRVSRKKMVELLNESDIYISTSISDGTSVSLLEAMACNKPVIVSDIPCNREWIKIGINGFLAPVGNDKIFANYISTLSSDIELQKKMGERNYIIANERADWCKNFNKLENIYKEIINE